MSVIVYSTKECPWCKKTKEFLKEHKISFTNKFVDDNQKAAQEMMKKSGQMGVPVIDTGKEIIVGFNEPALRKAFKIK